MRHSFVLAAAGLVAGCASGPVGPVNEAGTLATGDATLASGEFADSFPVSLSQDQWIRVELTSDDFDPYLQLRPPSGRPSENDDAVEGDAHTSQIILKASQAGQYEIVVTSRTTGENGAYGLKYEVFDAEPPPVLDPQQSATGPQTKQGALATGDRALRSNELYDPYPVRLKAGQTITITLRSASFDPYLILKQTTGETVDNDDTTPGDTETSTIVFTAEHDGQYAIMVTSYESGEKGPYTLTYEISGGSGSAAGPRTKPEADPGAPAEDSEATPGVRI